MASFQPSDPCITQSTWKSCDDFLSYVKRNSRDWIEAYSAEQYKVSTSSTSTTIRSLSGCSHVFRYVFRSPARAKIRNGRCNDDFAKMTKENSHSRGIDYCYYYQLQERIEREKEREEVKSKRKSSTEPTKSGRMQRRRIDRTSGCTTYDAEERWEIYADRIAKEPQSNIAILSILSLLPCHVTSSSQWPNADRISDASQKKR